ncbi:MAG: BspA family leucine-rich repeat surface protein [Bacteroidaceae bacterium]|nr:BspA family leucine-rich repeat surface protein [Bacteroidaceae bacterium]
MKTIKKLLLLLLCLVTFGAAQVKALEAYAVFNNYSLTFYYDDLRSTRTGTTYNVAGSLDSSGDKWLVNKNSIVSVTFDSSFSAYHPTGTAYWFSECSLLVNIYGIQYLNTSNATNMYGMFYGCHSLTKLDVSHFNTEKVTSMSAMFSDCIKLTSLDVSNFNTANVIYMSQMFRNCSSLKSLDLTNYNTTNLALTSFMFDNCSSLKTIYCNDAWSPTDSQDMFRNCSSLSSKSSGLSYDSSKTSGAYANPCTGYFTGGISYAIYTPSNNTLTFYCDDQRSLRPGNIYDFNEGQNAPDWLTYASNIHHVVFDSSMDNARPTNTNGWFAFLRNLTDITGLQYLHTENVTNMNGMFRGITSLTSLDLTTFNTANVTSMANMFNGCTGLTTLNLISFNPANVTTMDNMFNGCSDLATIVVSDNWRTSSVTSSTNMFSGCTSLVGRNGTAYDANHVDKEYARIDNPPTNPGYLSDSSSPNIPTVSLQLSILGEGTLSLLDGSTEVVSITDGETTTISWQKGQNFRLVAAGPQGFDLTNAQAYIIVDGNSQQMTKNTDEGNNPYFVYEMSNVTSAHTLTLVLTGLGPAVESNMAITVSGSGTVECVVLKNDGTSTYTQVESNEYKEVSYYPDEVDDGAVFFLFSKPQAGQTLKVFRNGFDVTSTLYESTQQENTLGGGFTLNTTYMAMCPWGAITPSSIMAVYENNATHTLLLTGNQVGKAFVYWLDEDGIALDDLEANATEPYATMWDSMDDVVSARLAVKDIPEGYIFKAYFNGVEITDFTLNQFGTHNAILEGETIKQDGTWLVNFIKEGADDGTTLTVTMMDAFERVYLIDKDGNETTCFGTSTVIDWPEGESLTVEAANLLGNFVYEANLIVDGTVVPLVYNAEKNRFTGYELSEVNKSQNIVLQMKKVKSYFTAFVGAENRVEVAEIDEEGNVLDASGGPETSTLSIANTSGVRLTFTPAEGKVLTRLAMDGWTVSLDDERLTQNANGKYVFTFPAGTISSNDHQVYATFSYPEGDLNGDGEINVSDVTSLVNKILHP